MVSTKHDLLTKLSIEKLKELANKHNISLRNEWTFANVDLTQKVDIVDRIARSNITIKQIEAFVNPVKKRKSLSKATKTLILKSQDYECARCHMDISKLPIHYDHRIPIALGGTDDVENIQALCPNCHAIKSEQDRLAISRAKK